MDAADVLDLARPGTAPDRIRVGDVDMSVETWRRTNRADFERSCAALRTASQAEPGTVKLSSGITSVLMVLLPAVIGALLAWLAGERRDVTARNRSSAEALRSSARAFLHAWDN
ncbi:MAG: hypothetical protein LC799_13375, partial [Actinobacteria bacterium]|nr:hypothetical protein [Actinomycetota bacterium]